MESIETLNQRLRDVYGLDSDTGRPIFRIVWANDETEKILTDEIEGGIKLLYPQLREVKKYPYMRDMYVLERLVVVPDVNKKELLGKKLSYEPLWPYADKNNQPLPPIWEATKFVIDAVHAALGKKSLRKYVEDEKDTSPEGREQRISQLEADIFGNESQIGDALRYKEGIVVPTSYKGSK